MSKEQLGFDPTIFGLNNKQYIEKIKDNNCQQERFILEKLTKQTTWVARQVMTYWKPYHEGDKSKKLLIVKDCKMLREVIEKGMIKMERYYFHKTVQVDDQNDDIGRNMRHGLFITFTHIEYKPR